MNSRRLFLSGLSGLLSFCGFEKYVKGSEKIEEHKKSPSIGVMWVTRGVGERWSVDRKVIA